MWYLCVFFHRLLDYRKPEVEALAELFGAFPDHNNGDTRILQWKLPDNFHNDCPFHFVNLPSEEIACKIAKRSELFFFLILSCSFLVSLNVDEHIIV